MRAPVRASRVQRANSRNSGLTASAGRDYVEPALSHGGEPRTVGRPLCPALSATGIARQAPCAAAVGVDRPNVAAAEEAQPLPRRRPRRLLAHGEPAAAPPVGTDDMHLRRRTVIAAITVR